MPPPPARIDKNPGEGASGSARTYVGIGRMGFGNTDAPAFRKERKKKPDFNPAEGRDYTQDAPVSPEIKNVREEKEDKKAKVEEAVVIPEVKSPA